LRGIGLGSIQTGSDVDYWWFEAFAGDRVAIAVETPDNGMNPYVELRNSADGVLDSDDNDGANNDPLISYYTIASSGRYNVRVRSQSNSTGHYEVRVDQVRGTTQLESDAQYANALWAGPIGWPNILLVAWSRRQWPAQ
jgi:hypothetical protein